MAWAIAHLGQRARPRSRRLKRGGVSRAPDPGAREHAVSMRGRPGSARSPVRPRVSWPVTRPGVAGVDRAHRGQRPAASRTGTRERIGPDGEAVGHGRSTGTIDEPLRTASAVRGEGRPPAPGGGPMRRAVISPRRRRARHRARVHGDGSSVVVRPAPEGCVAPLAPSVSICRRRAASSGLTAEGFPPELGTRGERPIGRRRISAGDFAGRGCSGLVIRRLGRAWSAPAGCTLRRGSSRPVPRYPGDLPGRCDRARLTVPNLELSRLGVPCSSGCCRPHADGGRWSC